MAGSQLLAELRPAHRLPSADGPQGDRDERIYFELSSQHLQAECERVGDSIPDPDQEAAYERQASQVWQQVAACFGAGAAGRELAAARRAHPMRIAAFDYNPGEGPFRLDEDGRLA